MKTFDHVKGGFRYSSGTGGGGSFDLGVASAYASEVHIFAIIVHTYAQPSLNTISNFVGTNVNHRLGREGHVVGVNDAEGLNVTMGCPAQVKMSYAR